MPLWKMLSDQHGGNPVAHTSRAFVRTRGAGSVRSSTGLKHESGPRKSAREASVTWLLPFGPTCWTDRTIAQRGISVYAQVSVDAIASTPSTSVYGPEHRNASFAVYRPSTVQTQSTVYPRLPPSTASKVDSSALRNAIEAAAQPA